MIASLSICWIVINTQMTTEFSWRYITVVELKAFYKR